MSVLLLLAACAPAVTDVAPHQGRDEPAEDPVDEPGEDPVYEPVEALHFEQRGALERGEMELLHAAPDLDGDGLRELIFLDGEDLLYVPLQADLSLGEPSRLPYGQRALTRVMLSSTGGRVSAWDVEATDAGDLDGDGDDELILQVWIGIEGGSVTTACGTFAYDDEGWSLLRQTSDSTCTPIQMLADADGDGGAELLVHDPANWSLLYSRGYREPVTLTSGILGSVYRAHSHLLYLNSDDLPELVSFPDAGYGFAGGGYAVGSAYSDYALQPYGVFIHGYTTASERGNARPDEMMLLDSSGEIWWLGAGVDAPTMITEPTAGAWYGLFGQLDGVRGLDALFLGDTPRAYAGDGSGGLTELGLELTLEDGEIFTSDLDGDGLDDLVLDHWGVDAGVQVWRNTSQD
ncbi:MAG: hypothetical protein H6741_00025 [Alphaproteobacteria bacterium]|nr:hypothetical protein [Alphaproteobacteria bacterium]MCB9791091.1 hypothetical protein [Alphaproteobacteria bacterium]